MDPLLTIVQQYMHRNDLFAPKHRILVAISGGPDSVFLAHCLQELGYSIGLAHVNYQLRGAASQADEALVRKYADRWGVPCYVIQATPKKYAADQVVSLQVACRDIRYAFFEGLIEEEGFDRCATAHHASDQVETILMNFLKGNSTSVLKGIPSERGQYIRPLLQLNKEEILAYLEDHQLAYRIDESNLQQTYLRNQIRHSLIPSLEQIQPSAKAQIVERFSWYRLQHELLTNLMAPILQTSLGIRHGFPHLNTQIIGQQFGSEASKVFLAHQLEQWGIHGQELWQGVQLLESKSGNRRRLLPVSWSGIGMASV